MNWHQTAITLDLNLLKCIWRFSCLCCGLLLMSSGLIAQDSTSPREDYESTDLTPRNFDTEKWQETIDGIDYSQSFRKDTDYDEDFSDAEGNKKKNQQENGTLGGSSSFWNNLVKILFVTLGLGMLIFVVVSMLRGNLFRPRSKTFNTEGAFDIETIEEHIHESDLNRLIQQTLSEENYALAIRLYYLAIIKELSIRRIIKWKKDKTNRDYQRELQGYSLFREFREATRIFERVWYGNRELMASDFQRLQPRFQQWINQAQQTQKISS